MQYNCSVQIVSNTPVKEGNCLFLLWSNRNLLVSDSLLSPLNLFINIVKYSTIVLYLIYPVHLIVLTSSLPAISGCSVEKFPEHSDKQSATEPNLIET